MNDSTKKKANWIALLVIILSVLVIWMVWKLWPSDSQSSTTQENIAVVFDIDALYGKNIDEVRAILWKPIDNSFEPTSLQIKTGVKEWDNTFKKDNRELLITYDVNSRKIIDFFISSDSGMISDIISLEKISNVSNSIHFTIEPVKALANPSLYTGIKIIPK